MSNGCVCVWDILNAVAMTSSDLTLIFFWTIFFSFEYQVTEINMITKRKNKETRFPFTDLKIIQNSLWKSQFLQLVLIAFRRLNNSLSIFKHQIFCVVLVLFGSIPSLVSCVWMDIVSFRPKNHFNNHSDDNDDNAKSQFRIFKLRFAFYGVLHFYYIIVCLNHSLCLCFFLSSLFQSVYHDHMLAQYFVIYQYLVSNLKKKNKIPNKFHSIKYGIKRIPSFWIDFFF